MKKNHVREVNLLYLVDLLLIILGFTALVAIVGLICIPFGGMGIDYEQVTQDLIDLVQNNQILAMILSQAFIGIPIVFFCINRRKLVKEEMRFNKISPKTGILLIVLTYTLIPVMTFINMVSMIFVDNKVSGAIDSIVNQQSIIVAVLCVAMLPAFVEEILCRGIIYNVHSKVSVKKAIIMNGILFGLLHCNFNQFAYAFFMGMVFALVVEITNSTLSTILMHFIINSNSMVIAYVSGMTGEKLDIEEIEYTAVQVLSWGVMAGVALILSLSVFVAIAKENGRWEYIQKEVSFFNKKNLEESADIKKQSLIDIYLVIAMIISVIYMIAAELV